MKRALVRYAPVAIPRMLDKIPDDVDRDLYDTCRLHVGARVLVSHDRDEPVGYVRELSRMDDYDGLWHVALLDLDTVPEWLKVGTGVSVGGRTLARGSLLGRSITRDMQVTEISIVGPGREPKEPWAKVLTLHDVEVEQPRATRTVAAPTAPPRNRRGQVDEDAWVNWLVDREGWDFEDAINAVKVACGYDAFYLDPNRRRRIQIAA